jgi:hypothetical protein
LVYEGQSTYHLFYFSLSDSVGSDVLASGGYDLHGKLDLGKSKGLKQSEIKKLNRLLQKRIPKDKILTLELADSVAEISQETGYPLSVVVNRRGHVVNVTVGHPFEVKMPS